MACKLMCRWGYPATIQDGGKLVPAPMVRTQLKRAGKGSAEARRLQALLDGQARLCWTCGERCSEAEAARLSGEVARAS